MLEEPKFIKRFYISIENVAEHEYSVCTIYYQHEKWAVITQDDEVTVHFYSPNSKDHWEFPLEVAIEVLQKARKIFLSK